MQNCITYAIIILKCSILYKGGFLVRNLNIAAIYHICIGEYRFALADGSVCIRLRTAKGDWDRVILLTASNYDEDVLAKESVDFNMELAASDDIFDYYESTFMPHDPRLKYMFRLESGTFKMYYNQDGPCTVEEVYTTEGAQGFPFAYVYPSTAKPEWAQGNIAYQIFPDRFSIKQNEASGIEPWDSDKISSEYFFGGNIQGMIETVPYLKELGVGMVYLNPIFLSDTSHRYNTFDYLKIDPMLGNEEDLKMLAETLHKNGIRLVLDGVFNHSGKEFAPFKDALEKGKESKYYDWFCFGSKESPECGYACFAFEPYMPKLNLRNKECQEYFISVGKYWIERCGIDGWRMDVSPEVYPNFWREFRTRLHEIKDDLLLVAECWDDSREWCSNGDMFDSTMHYIWSRAVWHMFAYCDISLNHFNNLVNKAFINYPKPVTDVLWNLLGSHDTARFITRAGERTDRLRAAVFFQMTCPGSPTVYYGDEIGMSGETDPYCRKPMQWQNTKNNELLEYFKKLIHIRTSSNALRIGNFRSLLVDDETGVYAYTRNSSAETMLCILCAKETNCKRFSLKLPKEFSSFEKLKDILSGNEIPNVDGMISLDYEFSNGFIFNN